MSKPFINDALVGNGSVLAVLSATGRLHRLWWPSVDFGQHVHTFRVGISSAPADPAVWLDDCPGEVAYVGDTEVLSYRHELGPDGQVVATVFASVNQQAFLHHVEWTQCRAEHPSLLVRSDFRIYEQSHYQATQFRAPEGVVVHYFRDVYIAVGFVEGRLDRYRAAHLSEPLSPAALDGEASGLGSQSALSKRFSQAGTGHSITVCLAFGTSLTECLDTLAAVRTAGFASLQQEVLSNSVSRLERYEAFPPSLHAALSVHMARQDAPENFAESVYRRSLLTFHWLQGTSGAMIAAPEFDEAFSRCGGYAFCWGRDAAFIVSAMEMAGMTDAAERFYDWAVAAQDPEGYWEHRHYLDGRVAPSWGLQYDETASLLWGMARHVVQDSGHCPALISRWLPALHKAATVLLQWEDQETGLLSPSVDLWEERTAEHTYSTAAAASALSAFAAMCEHPAVQAELEAETEAYLRLASACRSASDRLTTAIRCAVSGVHGGFLRARELGVTQSAAEAAQQTGQAVRERVDTYGYTRIALEEDHVIDVSLLGLCIPFGVIDPMDETMRRTADLIEERLTREVGGIGRYEADPYIGGNPWILATLWLALYKLQSGDRDGAAQLAGWCLSHATPLGFLPEQIDRHTGAVAWVNPLAWSHAMYVWFVIAWKRSFPESR